MKLKGNEGLLAPILQRVYHCHTILKKIVNKEVLCNLQLSHKHSGLGYAQMVGKCEFDFIHKI